jgi:rhodanese-related sulfurtransferase
MKKKFSITFALICLIGSLANSSSLAQNAKLVSQTTLVIPIQAGSFQIVSIPFFQALPVEASFQIKVVKELRVDYKLKVGLGGKYVQKDFTVGPLQPGTTDMLTFRIETPKELLPGEQYAKIMIGSTEDSSYSATINLYLQPVVPKEMQLTINKTQAVINHKPTTMDVAPMIIKGRTMVPFRFIGTELGAKIDYTMNPSTKLVETVTFQLGRKSIKLTIGSNLVETVNDKEKIEKKLDAPPVIIKGRTLIPLRFVSEELGSSITWEGTNSTIGTFFPKSDPKPEDNGTIFFTTITAEELQQMIVNKDKKFLLDIRVESEYKKGHIPTAQNLFETYINEEGLTKAGIQKSDKIIIYCNSGLRSILFCELLTNSGYTNVYTLAKGLSGWRYGLEK